MHTYTVERQVRQKAKEKSGIYPLKSYACEIMECRLAKSNVVSIESGAYERRSREEACNYRLHVEPSKSKSLAS